MAFQAMQHEAREVQRAEHVENQERFGRLEREMLSTQSIVKLAFPEGDADAHRRYHEELIRKAKVRADFYQELRTELAKKGIWAVIVLLGIALWAFVKSKVVQ